MSELTNESRARLVSDLKVVLADAEELLRLTASDASGKLADVRGRLGVHVDSAKLRLGELEDVVVARTKEVAKATDTYVHEHPWQSIGVAAGVAFLLGMLSSRR
ncbi:MAG: DUF883 family protein [Candidatus Dactylopiibacterium sp.]|nr:DUF883 family protein [Candidatus Dactylopiibacterium sp.]